MNSTIGAPEIGQWYARTDQDALFQVVGRDDDTRTIEIQYFDGDVDEFDAEVWGTLPLERTEPPEDCTGPMDGERTDDVDQDEANVPPTSRARCLHSIIADTEAWEDLESEDERDPLGVFHAA
jgi:uncharacterized protein DUF6763